MNKPAEQRIHTRIWREEPEPDNPFATKAAYCHGFNVFGEMLGRARWVDMLYLLLRGEAPTRVQADILEALAVALANPGPRDQSVHAAMCGGVAGSSAAASLMAALAVGAGRYCGAREVFDAMSIWIAEGLDLVRWATRASDRTPSDIDVWPDAEHPPGFDPHGVSTATIVCQLLEQLAAIGNSAHLGWLAEHREELEARLGLPLAISGVAAATFVDLGFSAKQGEMLFLLLRLPGAAAHALEQEEYGFKQFPFYPVELQDDPARQETT